MSKALSLDLRVRVLAAVAGGMSHRAAGERCGVSAASVSRWRTRAREQGDARPKALGGVRKSQRIDAHKDAVLAALGPDREARGLHGVTRQSCGHLGKQDNCQVAVSLSIANHAASLPIAYKLYLPEDWASDPLRRSRAGVPDDVAFHTKPEIALDHIRAALAAGIPAGPC